MAKKIKVAIIGCGQISDAHLGEISLLADAEVVAVCDLLTPLAEDTADRFNIRNAYSDYHKMIEETRPDVVHITTPPHTHLPIGVDVIRKGCHTYIEKPFGVSLEEASKIIEAAQANNLIACAGFSQLFDVVTKRVNEHIQSGRLGDIVHMETYYGESLDGNFSRLFLQNKAHWIHNLPGKMFQNVISHALYHIVPHLPDKIEKVSCLTQDRSNNGVLDDELRVMIQSGNVTGFVTYTNSVHPITQFFRLYGTKSIIHVDLGNHNLTITDTTGLPGPIARIRNAMVPGKNLIREGALNIKNLFTAKDRFFAGMGGLFDSLYQNIRDDRIQPPVPYEHILKHSSLMDEIGKHCSKGVKSG